MNLMPWAEEAQEAFYRSYGVGNCSCHISAPCGSCTHEGNPVNLAENPYAWAQEYEVLAAYARIEIAALVERLAAKHIAEMRQNWKGE